jgi:hypothetical protein
MCDFLTQHRRVAQLFKEQNFHNVLARGIVHRGEDALPRVHERLKVAVPPELHRHQVLEVVQRPALFVKLVMVVDHPQDLPTFQHPTLCRRKFDGEVDAPAQLTGGDCGQGSGQFGIEAVVPVAVAETDEGRCRFFSSYDPLESLFSSATGGGDLTPDG